MKTCVFAGTFDPITKGHTFVIDKCLELFDKVVVAIGVNVDKKPLFTLEERFSLILAEYGTNEKVKVTSFSGMLTDFMKENDITVTVRGLRNQDDYKYETVMAQYNRDLYPQITTIYIPTPNELLHVSSSGVRNIIELSADYQPYLTEKVAKRAKEILKNK